MQEIPVADPVTAKQRDPVRLCLSALGRQVQVGSKDRLDARVQRGPVKAHRAEHVIQIGQRHGRHAAFAHRAAKAAVAIADAQHGVHQGILRVQAQMDELRCLFH